MMIWGASLYFFTKTKKRCLILSYMVRINLIKPKSLADQHLVAEYNEILMFLGHVRKFPAPNNIPERFTLGSGHIRFFKDKLGFIAQRHELLKDEMRRRGFVPQKTINLEEFPEELRNDWRPMLGDYELIRNRIKEKIALKPDFYRYEGKPREPEFFQNLLRAK